MRADIEQMHMKISEILNLDAVPDLDSNAARETSYLLSVPGMLDSLKEGFAQSPKELAKTLDW